MYQITYKKRNGEIFYRIRNTLPLKPIGKETSMGWIILDIKYEFNGNYYSHADYCKITKKYYEFVHLKNKLLKIFKKYSLTITLIILVIILFLKIKRV